MENPKQSELSVPPLPHSMGIQPPPILKPELKSPKNHQEYLPNQIHGDEQCGGYIDCKLNETMTNDAIKIKDDNEKVNEKVLQNESIVKENEMLPYPDKNKGKKAIKLFTVPQENEALQNQNQIIIPNPQEYDSPTLDIKNQSLDVEDSRKDSSNLSPNSVKTINFLFILLFCFFD